MPAQVCLFVEFEVVFPIVTVFCCGKNIRVQIAKILDQQPGLTGFIFSGVKASK